MSPNIRVSGFILYLICSRRISKISICGTLKISSDYQFQWQLWIKIPGIHYFNKQSLWCSKLSHLQKVWSCKSWVFQPRLLLEHLSSSCSLLLSSIKDRGRYPGFHMIPKKAQRTVPHSVESSWAWALELGQSWNQGP